ncbi:DUF2846 domain-containing protein [Pseudomonas lopnurensis]|uniref:DUF2846 domain-containing protein n=1 Tax=Pseudomonas lopnurensis TaxID=1477517 RepID=UPI0028AB736B|nr:DUF2846 domain-containing protein [Pseudomonas lopnurensis]
MEAAVSGYTLPQTPIEDMGLVYVVRPSSSGTLVRFNVFLDDREPESEMGYTRGNQYIYFYATPGRHLISSKAENWAELELDVKSGEVAYVRQDVQMGVIMARNGLTALNELEGRYLVKESSLGTVIKAHK